MHFLSSPRSFSVYWLLGLASAILLAAAPAQYFGRQHDDVLFVIASQALSDGRYVLFTSPDRPPLAHVWPGLPALLLPVTWTAGDFAPAYQLALAAALAACPWALWLWLRTSLEPRTAAAISLVFATSPLVLSQAGCVMPEAPYVAASALLFWSLADGARTRRHSGWLLALSVLLRPAGLSLAPAALLEPLRRGRWALAARVGAPAAVGVLAWLGWSWARSGFIQEGREWATSYEGRGAAGLLELPLANARFFAGALGGSFLPPSWEGGYAALALGFVLALLAAAGAWRKRGEPASAGLAAAAGMHLFWGWSYERYLIPLLPLLLWAAASAVPKRAVPALGALLGLQLVFQTTRFLGPSPVGTPELKETYAWLRERMGEGDTLASPLYARDGFYVRRPSVPLASAPDAGELARLLKSRRVRYVLWQDLDLGLAAPGRSSVTRALGDLRTQLSTRRHFRPVRDDPGASAVVFEVLP